MLDPLSHPGALPPPHFDVRQEKASQFQPSRPGFSIVTVIIPILTLFPVSGNTASWLFKNVFGGVWVAQSVKRLALDFGLDHDLMVWEFEPHIGLHADSVEPARDPVSLSLPLPYFSLSLSLSQSK